MENINCPFSLQQWYCINDFSWFLIPLNGNTFDFPITCWSFLGKEPIKETKLSGNNVSRLPDAQKTILLIKGGLLNAHKNRSRHYSIPDMCPISSWLNEQLSTFQHFAKQVTGADSWRQLPHTQLFLGLAVECYAKKSPKCAHTGDGRISVPITLRDLSWRFATRLLFFFFSFLWIMWVAHGWCDLSVIRFIFLRILLEDYPIVMLQPRRVGLLLLLVFVVLVDCIKGECLEQDNIHKSVEFKSEPSSGRQNWLPYIWTK